MQQENRSLGVWEEGAINSKACAISNHNGDLLYQLPNSHEIKDDLRRCLFRSNNFQQGHHMSRTVSHRPEKMSPNDTILRTCLLSNNTEINSGRVGCKNALWRAGLFQIRKYGLFERDLFNNSLQRMCLCA
ncbi:hypothetical protein DsansV1_C11g0108541 [Dioscorea sansibarensis]